MNDLKAALIGEPVSHSLSPTIFSTLSDVLGLRLNYEAIQVNSSQLPQFIRNASSDFVGLNVTLPHKQRVSQLVDTLSAEAIGVGAVNVVAFVEGKSFGSNTDVIGIRKSLEALKVREKGSRVLCLGAGGAARAVAYALASSECAEFVVLNKTLTNAQSLIQHFETIFPNTSFRAIGRIEELGDEKAFSLVVNSTPLGMKSSSQEEHLFFAEVLNWIECTVAFDLIYTPSETAFMKMAYANGYRALGGLEMLIQQAIATWELWFSPVGTRRTEVETILRNKLRDVLNENQNVYLSGFMGVGKSTIARILATKLGMDYVDTDHWIEQKTGKKVAQIFQEDGEAAFRTHEKDAIRELSTRSGLVIALGGGILAQSVNMASIKSSGTLIYLEASVDCLLERLKNSYDRRPLLNGFSHLRERIAELLNDRVPVYEQASWKIQTDGQSPQQVADAIADRMAK